MLCSQTPSIRLDDRPLAMSDWEKPEDTSDLSSVYERKANCDTMTEEDTQRSQASAECRCLREESPDSLRCSMHKEFFPSLEAINEEAADETKAVEELKIKYDLSLPDRHHREAKNMGYLRHHKGRHFRRKTFGKDGDLPARRERSVTF